MQYSEIYKNLKKALLSIDLLLLLASCNGDRQSSLDEIAPFHPTPQIVALNTGEGYTVNPFTGDSIQPIINSLGDTIKTGVPVTARAKVIDPKSVALPKVIPAGKPIVVRAHQTVHKLPGNLTVIPVNKSSLKTFTPGVDTSSFVLFNSMGDTVPTGVPIPARGKVVPCIQTQPVRALPPLMKDNASINIKYLDVVQGMKSTQVTSILEDSRGNIWICNQGDGVSMYNGETFVHFTQKEGLSDDWVTSVLEDKQGNIWFGTLGGVSKYDGNTFTHFSQKEGLCHNAVTSILEDSHGNLWFGTWGGGVSKLNDGCFTHFTQKEGLCHNLVFSILEDKHGDIWFGTQGGVSIYNGLTFRHLPEKQGLINNWVWSMLEDSHGNIWVGTDDGLCLYDGETITHFTQIEGLSDNHIRSILEDSHGNLWFGTHVGVSMYDGKTFRHFTNNEGLSANRIRSIMEDSQGNLWFCTEQGGVSIYYGSSFTHITRKEGLSEPGVLSIFEDSRGNFWFGTWGGGVNMYNGETFMHFTKNEGLISNTVRTILEDNQGNIWFGTFEGLCKFNGETFTHFTQNEGLCDNNIISSLKDSQGKLWFGTDGGGVSIYDGNSFMNLTKKDGLSDNHVNAIVEDCLGNLWFGTWGGGVSMYNGETFTHYTQKEGLSSNNVRSILEDSRGNLWFGIRGEGVCMFNGENFSYFTQKEGLSDSWVISIIEDSSNNIWFGTHNGLNRLAFEPETDSVTIKTYGLQDGLKGIGFGENSVLSDSKNRLWWGTDKALTMLDINNLKIPIEPPVMHLNRIDIDRQFIDYRHLDDSIRMKMNFDSVAMFYNYPLNLTLPHNRNNLTFYFSAIDWFAAQKLKYSYILLGWDDKWNTPAEEANIEYRNLPQGRYTFKVRAIGAAERWSEPFEYTFKVLPPFWLTWWAYTIYTIILLLLVRWYRGFLINREKVNADLKIKEVEVKKMQELDHMKSRFFANISHEFRTPLTLIQGPIEELRTQFKGNLEGSIHLFQTVKRNTQRLQDLINQLLDISKLETGNVKLQVSRGNLVEFMKAIVLSFLSLADYRKINYEYDLPLDGEKVYFEADKIEKILTNLISNAFKFTNESGKINVGIRFLESSQNNTKDSVEIKVSDTGKGIPEALLDKIFDRFYRVGDPDTGEIEGTGLGLALTKELVELYRGNISVESEMGKGSCFTVILPVSVALFRDKEIVKLSSEENIISEVRTPVHKHEDYKDTGSLEHKIPVATKDKAVILIVEDNDDLRNYVSRNLESTYSILSAENGKVGLDIAHKEIPDLIICDVMMPVMDGMQMCKLLKTDERTDHIPLIMLTARADRISKLEGLETGADDYLIKPFDTEELKIRVKNLLEQRRKLRKKFRLDFLSSATDLGLPPRDHFIERLLDIFDQHISDSDFKMSQLSGELNLSQSQVERKVMAIAGYTPNELFRNHRLKRAAALFRSGQIHVAQVMHRVGFNNQSYFTKCFRELFHMTPSKFITDCKK